MKKSFFDDLEEIKVPESKEYFLMLILQRHLLNFYFEVKQLNLQDPEYLPALLKLLENPDQHNEDMKSSYNELFTKKMSHLKTLVEKELKDDGND